MKKAFVELGLIVAAIVGIHTSRIVRSASIEGKLPAAYQTSSVYAVSGLDSVRAVNANGGFGIKVDPGVWKIIVAYRTPGGEGAGILRSDLRVTEGQTVDLGEVRFVE